MNDVGEKGTAMTYLRTGLALAALLGAIWIGLRKEQNPMDIPTEAVATAAIPAIDAVVPVHTETATFALG